MNARTSWSRRLVAVVGLVFGAAWLVWRCTSSLAGSPVWLSASTLAVEVVGFAAAAMLVWALWPDVHSGPVGADRSTGPVTVVVRCRDESIEAVRATLLAARRIGPAVLLDCSPMQRDDLADLAGVEGVLLKVDPRNGTDPLVALARHVSDEALVLLEAGQIPAPDVVARLAPWFAADVAVVQGDVVSLDADDPSTQRRPFDRVLNAALGTRGAAQFLGGGALVRTAALAGLRADPDDASDRSDAGATVGRGTATTNKVLGQMQLTIDLFGAGWRIEAPGVPAAAAPEQASPPSAHPALTFSGRVGTRATDPVRAELGRAEAACAARLALSTACAGPRRMRLEVRQRLALLAWAVVPLSGIRRSLLAAVLVATLLQGELPFRLALGPAVGLWLPWFVLGALGLCQLSGGALRPGDRSTEATLRVGTSWRGLTTPNGDIGSGRSPLGLLLGIDHSAGVVLLVGALSVVVGLRGLSDRVTHTLHPLDTSATVAVLVTTLWVLVAGLATLQLLSMRSLRPRSTRVATSLGSVFAGVPAMVADISVRGAAVVGPLAAEVGDQHELELVVPTGSGCVSARLEVVVRHTSIMGFGTGALGERRIGVEFIALPAHVRDVLIEFCLVQPAFAALSVPGAVGQPAAAHRPVVAFGRTTRQRWVGLRLAVMAALVGAAASASAPAVRASSSRAVRRLSDDVLGDPSHSGWEQQPALRWLVPTVTVLLAAPVLVGLLAAPVLGRRRPRPPFDGFDGDDPAGRPLPGHELTQDVVSLGRRPHHLWR